MNLTISIDPPKTIDLGKSANIGSLRLIPLAIIAVKMFFAPNNAANSRIEFYNTSDIMESTAQSYIDYDIAGCDELQVSILISDGVVVMYVNDEVAFTSRMYLSQGMEWGLFSINSKVNFEATKLYK